MGEEVPGDISGIPLEEIGHENLIGVFFVSGSEDICTLEGLVEVATK